MESWHKELYHHGIKGQRWGVRRYQNEDGSLTTKGKSRYGRGKEYNKEFKKIENEERIKLYNSDKEFNDLYNKAMKIAEKYDLDQDDGGGGDYEHFSEEQLRRAGQKYWELTEKYSDRQEVLDDMAHESARNKLIQKYGNTALDDINHYSSAQNVLAATIFIGALGGLGFLVTR